MGAFHAYLDDSGTHQGSSVVTVAGAVASVPQAYHSLFQIRNAGLIYTQDNIESALDRICRDLEARSQKLDTPGSWQVDRPP